MLSLSAQAAQYKEGEHYKVLDLEASKSQRSLSTFFFHRPHCNTFEPIIQQLKAQLPKTPSFKKSMCLLWEGVWERL